MTFSGTFNITKRDNIYYNHFRMQKKLFGIAVLTFVILTVMISLVRYSLGVSIENSLASALLIAAAGVVLIISVNIVSACLRVNNLYRQGRMSDFTVHYVVDQSGIHAKSERGDTDFEWNQILFAKETRHAFYLVAGENRAVVIPKKQIQNDGECNALRALFRKYIAAGQVKPSK